MADPFENNPTPDLPDGENPFRERTEEELRAEMEDVREKLQEEVDKMMEANPEKEWDDVVKEAVEEKAAAKAAQAPATDAPDNSEPEGDAATPAAVIPEKPKKEKKEKGTGAFEWWHFLIPVISVIFLAFSVIFTVHDWNFFAGTARAEKRAMMHYPVSALSQYQELNQQLNPTNSRGGAKFRSNQVRLYRHMGFSQFSNMDSYIKWAYPGRQLKTWPNHYAASAEQEIEDYKLAAGCFQTAAQQAKDFKSFLTAYDKVVKDQDIPDAYKELFRYYGAVVMNEDTAVQKKYAEAIRDCGKKYASMYQPMLAEIALAEKDYDEAVKLSNQMLHRNKEDSFAYGYKVMALRMSNKAIEAEQVCKEGLKADNTSPALNYQMAVMSLLKGDLKVAQSYAETALAYSESDDSASLYALCTGLLANDYQKKGDEKHAKDEQAKYDNIVSSMAQYNMHLSPDVEKILSGKKTVSQVFGNGKGDFTW